jgi:DNA polymerase III sliding clamp (beta) subunit (PCNA family)
MPILGHVLIDGLASSVTLVATDTEVELSIEVPHPTEEPGAFTLPGRMLYEICRITAGRRKRGAIRFRGPGDGAFGS